MKSKIISLILLAVIIFLFFNSCEDSELISDIEDLLQVENPEFYPAGGSYNTIQEVVIACPTPGAAIYYTTDGSLPTKESALYTGPFMITSNNTTTVINAFACKADFPDSDVSQSSYTLSYNQATPPYFSKSGGTYVTTQYIEIITTQAGATTYYTLDGSEPTASSFEYSIPIEVSGHGTTKTITALSIADQMVASPSVSEVYAINENVVGDPSFNRSSGLCDSGFTLQISGPATADIYYTYTTDGSEPPNPNIFSTKYSVPITIPGGEFQRRNFKAVCVTSGLPNSNIVPVSYVIDENYPSLLSHYPATNATNVLIDTYIQISFTEAIDTASIDSSSFYVNVSGGGSVSGNFTFPSANIARFTPSSLLSNTTVYTVTATSDITDLAGRALSNPQVWNFTTIVPPPSTPAITSPTNGATDQYITVDLDWGNCTNTGTYNLYFGTTTSPALYATGLTDSSYALPTLTAGTTYYWQIAAVGTGGITTGSVWSFTTADAPGTPTNVSPADGVTQLGYLSSITLDWAYVSENPVTSYSVLFGTSSSPGLFTTTASNVTQCTVTGIKHGTKYYWRIIANGPGGSTSTTTWSFTMTHSYAITPLGVIVDLTFVDSPTNSSNCGYDAHDNQEGGVINNGSDYWPDFYYTHDPGTGNFFFWGNNSQDGCVNMGSAFTEHLDVNVPVSGYSTQGVTFTTGDYLVFKADADSTEVPGLHTANRYYIILHIINTTPGNSSSIEFDFIYVYVEP